MNAVLLFLALTAASWQTVDFNGLFTFRLPDGFKRRATAEDGVRGEYQKDQTKLIVVWGRTLSPAYNNRRQDWMRDYHESTTRLRGLRANVRTYSQTVDSKRVYRAELNVGNWDKGEVQLYMRMETDDPAMLAIGEEIFKSIEFPLPSPERPSRPGDGDPLHAFARDGFRNFVIAVEFAKRDIVAVGS